MQVHIFLSRVENWLPKRPHVLLGSALSAAGRAGPGQL